MHEDISLHDSLEEAAKSSSTIGRPGPLLQGVSQGGGRQDKSSCVGPGPTSEIENRPTPMSAQYSLQQAVGFLRPRFVESVIALGPTIIVIGTSTRMC